MGKKHRVSSIFNIPRHQGTLDFVDVDIKTDIPLFVSPRALQLMQSDWGAWSIHLVQNFFQEVLRLISSGAQREAVELLEQLKEPNETHLGFSRGQSRGRALGTESAREVWEAIGASQAAKSGLLRDLEDTALMIPGIGVDIISDITINLIREPLIEYTQEMAQRFGIALQEGVESGPIWQPDQKCWISKEVSLPITSEGKLLLVPKTIVRADLQYKADQYYRHYVQTFLQNLEFESRTSLVRVLKDGSLRPPSKRAIEDKYGKGKGVNAEITGQHPEILENYRRDKDRESYEPLPADLFADITRTTKPDWTSLLGQVISLEPGKKLAKKYEMAVEGLLTGLFYPNLVHPNPQYPLHDRRKIVDIRYTNQAIDGFFRWLALHYSAGYVWIECKNYSDEVANAELDQLAGRFSPSRGQVGFLVCRSFKDKPKFLNRCRDSAQDGHGYIIPLDDEDLSQLVEERIKNGELGTWNLLRKRFDFVIS